MIQIIKKKNIKRINLDLNYNTDLDIINKNAYLKALIRKDMKKNFKISVDISTS